MQLLWNQANGRIVQHWREPVESTECYGAGAGGRIVHPYWLKWHLLNLGFSLPTKTGRQGLPLPWWLLFKGIAPRSLRKKFLGCKTGRGQVKIHQHFKGTERMFAIRSFLKSMFFLREGRSGAWSQEEVHQVSWSWRDHEGCFGEAHPLPLRSWFPSLNTCWFCEEGVELSFLSPWERLVSSFLCILCFLDLWTSRCPGDFLQILAAPSAMALVFMNSYFTFLLEEWEEAQSHYLQPL